jgi:hypothetical protein
MTMSRLFLMLAAGMLVFASTASADVPDCDCLDNWTVTWPNSPQNCLFVCPGAWGLPGHTAGAIADNKICLYKNDACNDPLVGFDCLRIDLSAVAADSICICDTEAGTWPYIMPTAATDGTGCTTFRWQGSILQMDTYPFRDGTVDEQAWLQVCGCQDRSVRFRSPDVNADCDVSLADFSIFGASFALYPCAAQPTGYQHYTVYNVHCAPCNHPSLADFSVFGTHFGHACTEYVPAP